MVSIIVSSYKQDYYEKLQKNIHETIGAPYELIKVDNPGLMGICKAYNIGASKAKFPFLCFVHEDVIFKTENWAAPLLKKFKTDISTGLIGVAGGKYKSVSPFGWFNRTQELDLVHILQHTNERKIEFISNVSQRFEEVVCVDGVFLFTTKEIWEKNKFDEKTFTNFHSYDLDFSFAISSTKKLYVTNTFLLEHFSEGSFNKKWIEETILFQKKWKTLLPQGKINKEMQKQLEWNNKGEFLFRMVKLNYPVFQLLSVYFGYGFMKFFSLTRALKTLKHIWFIYIQRNYRSSNISKL